MLANLVLFLCSREQEKGVMKKAAEDEENNFQKVKTENGDKFEIVMDIKTTEFRKVISEKWGTG